MSVKEEFQSIGKKLDEIRELLVNGPKQDSAELDQSDTADDDAEIVDDEMANEVGRLREELRRSRESEEALRQERDFFIKRSNEQGARLSQAKDQRDELQRWVSQLQAEQDRLRSERDADRVERNEVQGELSHDMAEQLKQERDQAQEKAAKLQEERDEVIGARDRLHDELQKASAYEKELLAVRKDCASAHSRNARLREERDVLDRISGEERQRAEKAEEKLQEIHVLVHGSILSGPTTADTVYRIHNKFHGR